MNAQSRIRVFVYLSSRLAAACEQFGMMQAIDTQQIHTLSRQSVVPPGINDRQLSEQFSKLAQQSVSGRDQILLVVGFWSILSYWASFLHDNRETFSRYSVDVFLSAFEDLLLDELSKLQVELNNLSDGLDRIKKNSSVAAVSDLDALARWAQSMPIGEPLERH